MSETVESTGRRRVRQVRAMLGLEVRKTFLRLRALPVVLIALLPVVILSGRILVHVISRDKFPDQVGEAAQIYGIIFQLFFIRFVVFFACFGIFTYLVRGEILERSLHFYLLAPLRREVFLVGKYVAGLVAASCLMVTSVIVQVILVFHPSATAGGWSYLTHGPGGKQLLAYVGVTILAVAGYGALFLAVSVLVRNPIIPAALLFGWEWANFLMPAVLKKFSIIHYLQSLCPVPIPNGPFALPAEPTPAPLAILGLTLVIAALLWFATRRSRGLETTYAAE
ncbi:MAG: hypothetical protein AB7G12_11750 [Thermoanaerobaculia bacterium]